MGREEQMMMVSDVRVTVLYMSPALEKGFFT